MPGYHRDQRAMLATSKQAPCTSVARTAGPLPARRPQRPSHSYQLSVHKRPGLKSDQAPSPPAAAGEGMAAAPAEAPAAAAAAEERELDFLNPKGERLFGKLVDTGSDDVVILCHG